jgi:tetratricopeptide (TPR) repeat protein
MRQLERAAGFMPEDGDTARFEKLEALLRRGGEPNEESVALVGNLLMLPSEGRYRKPDLSPLQIKQRTLEVLCGQVFALAREKPVLLVCEDAHWIDPSSLELLDLIVLSAAAARVLVIVTQRPEWNAPFLNLPNVTLMQLGRLGRRQITEIIRYIAAEGVSDEVLEGIIGRTDGIPLFVEEMTRSVVESGFRSGANTSNDIPESLQASLMARLDRLPAGARYIAQVASVIGREVSLPLLTGVVGGQPRETAESLEDLLRSQLMLKGGSSGEQQVVFRHALIRDAAYQSLLTSRRRQIHRRIATTIQEAFPQTVEFQPELVARHYAEAGEPLPAIAHWRRAGQRASGLMASHEAVDHYRNALAQLALTPPGTERDREELQLTLALGVPLIASTGHASDDVRRCYSRARELSELVKDPDGLFTSTRGLWNCIYDRAELHDALELAKILVGLAGPDVVKQALAQRALGSTYMNLGAFEDAIAAFDRCLASHANEAPSAAIGDQVEAPYIIALHYKGFVRCLQGRADEGLALVREALDHARKLGHPFALAFSLQIQSTALLLLGKYGPAHASATETHSLAIDHKFVFWIAGSKIVLGCAAVSLGSSGGLETGLEGLREWRATAAALHVPTWSALIADAALTAGDVETASSTVDDAVTVAHANHEKLAFADLQRLQGEIAIRRGDREGGKSHLEAAVSTANEQGAYLYGLRAANSLARLHLDAGNKEAARKVLEPIIGNFTDREEFPDLASARRVLAGS